jgi:hypothetical protein
MYLASTKKRRASTSTVPRDRDRDRGSAIKMVEKYAEDARKDLEMRQSDMEKRKLVPGDFNWFTKLPEYLTWRSAGSTELLWYVDKPGSGKTTVFQNIVVKLLDRQWHSREVDVAYVFCPESTSAEPSESHILPAAILRSIIGQLLARGDSRITELLKLLYGDYDRITMVLKLSNVDNDRITMVLNSGKTLDNLLGSHDTTPGILWGLLRLVIEATLDKETLIVIDGIDKIKAEDQLEFLKSLLMLRQGLPLKSVTKFLISSRPCAKIQDILKGVPSIDENIERRRQCFAPLTHSLH